MAKDFYDSIKQRRTIYGIGSEVTVPAERIEQVVKDAVKHVPSAFNSQSGRVLVLFDSHHRKCWNIVREALRKVVPEEQFAATEEKVDSFRNGYGTVLFFEDQNVVEGLQKQFALYKDNFPIWSLQSNGMLEFVVWTSLEIEGLGASLQHYNPLIDDEVKKEWGIPPSWKLLAQMPFGNIAAAPEEKQFQPLEERVKIFKDS